MLSVKKLNPSAALLVAARILVIGGIAATLARAIWSFVLGPEPAQVVELTRAQTPAANAIMQVEQIDRIAALNLFGAPRTDDRGLDVQAAPDTELDLRLLGIFRANRGQASVAIIGVRGSEGDAYAVGDRIFGNAKLMEIHKDVVLISRAGAVEALRFDDAPPLAANRKASNPAPDAPLAAVDAGAAPNGLEQSIHLFRARLEQDPEGTLRAVGLEPVSVDGAAGYRIGQGAGLGRTGLQPGDTILSIDGQPIGDFRQSPEAFGDLLEKGSARLEIQRGSRRFFLTTSLATLVALAATQREAA